MKRLGGRLRCKSERLIHGASRRCVLASGHANDHWNGQSWPSLAGTWGDPDYRSPVPPMLVTVNDTDYVPIAVAQKLRTERDDLHAALAEATRDNAWVREMWRQAEEDLARKTHGRHCPCSACEREDWTRPDLAPCGMHGEKCPPVYAPLISGRGGSDERG